MNSTELSRINAVMGILDQRPLKVLSENLYSTAVAKPVFIWTLNLSHLREYSQDDVEFRFLNSGCLVVADGWPIKTLSALLAKRPVQRIPGVDIVHELLSRGISFGVIGSNKMQVERTLSHPLAQSKNNLKFHFEKQIDLQNDSQVAEIFDLIKLNPAKFIFLALGFPKQESLFDLLNSKKSLSPGFYLGIGGSFEMLSGQKMRAPKLIQYMRLEWFWRFLQDPRRLFKRYMLDGFFFFRTLSRILFFKLVVKVNS